jgi:hypothetical protein
MAWVWIAQVGLLYCLSELLLLHADPGCAATAASAATPAAPSTVCTLQAASEEEREHAEQLMEYQNVRGGRVRLASMLQPETEFNHSEKVGLKTSSALDCALSPSPLALTR